MQTSPLFIGLTRPPAYMGLPVSYVVILFMTTIIGFVLTSSFLYLVASGGVGYGLLRALATYDPRFFDVFLIVTNKTPLVPSYFKGNGVTYRA